MDQRTDMEPVQLDHEATRRASAASGDRASGAVEESGASANEAPDPEVVAKPRRRRFTAEYKRRILQEADACAHGELGALLRREGLYYSTLRKWRLARDRGAFQALENKKPGPVAEEAHPAEARLAKLERENQRLREELTKAKTIIDVQKKFQSCWV